MALLVINHRDVERLLSMRECIDAIEQAFIAFTQGTFNQPLRTIYHPPSTTSLLGWMPAYRSGDNAIYGMKIVSVIPDNPQSGLDSHQGAVVLMDGQTGELRAVMDAAAITAMRTAAVSAVATRLLAREDASTLALIGSGVQARKHLEALPLVRHIRHVSVISRNVQHAQQFVEDMAISCPCPLEIANSIEEAVRTADIIVTATTAREPVLRHEWVQPGTHINAVGASISTHREIDNSTVAASAFFADCRESVEKEAGEYQLALQCGEIGPDHIKAELGELLTGIKPGRASSEDITLFRSLGLAIEDVATAYTLFQKASGIETVSRVPW